MSEAELHAWAAVFPSQWNTTHAIYLTRRFEVDLNLSSFLRWGKTCRSDPSLTLPCSALCSTSLQLFAYLETLHTDGLRCEHGTAARFNETRRAAHRLAILGQSSFGQLSSPRIAGGGVQRGPDAARWTRTYEDGRLRQNKLDPNQRKSICCCFDRGEG